MESWIAGFRKNTTMPDVHTLYRAALLSSNPRLPYSNIPLPLRPGPAESARAAGGFGEFIDQFVMNG